jgi:UPF0755 protein
MSVRALKPLTLVAVLIVLVAAGAYGGARWLEHDFRAAGPAPAALRIQVEPGVTVRTVLGRLARAGALAHPRLTELYLRLHGRHFRIKAGEYEIAPRASAAAIVAMLAEGRVVLEQLTVVEGTTFADLRHALESDPHVHATLRGRSDAEVMAALGHPDEQPEGRFFPDTYRFASGTSEVEILKIAYDKMRSVLATAWGDRATGLPLPSPYQALILASIIEKETGLATERPLIAGVFMGRLRKGMRLQSDPTVIYGLGSRYDGQIRTRDLTTDTPYNTYTRSGLPPTPIALPGRESILAAVHPAETGALYFVATGEGGAHQFSATLEEHNAAVQRYLARLRAQEAALAHRGSASQGSVSGSGSSSSGSVRAARGTP